MSSFNCPRCGKPILDTPKGYISECEHYKINKPQDYDIAGADVLMAIFGYKRIEVKTMNTYLFKGEKIKASSKTAVLRRFKLNTYDKKNLAMVTKVKKANG